MVTTGLTDPGLDELLGAAADSGGRFCVAVVADRPTKPARQVARLRGWHPIPSSGWSG